MYPQSTDLHRVPHIAIYQKVPVPSLLPQHRIRSDQWRERKRGFAPARQAAFPRVAASIRASVWPMNPSGKLGTKAERPLAMDREMPLATSQGLPGSHKKGEQNARQKHTLQPMTWSKTVR